MNPSFAVRRFFSLQQHHRVAASSVAALSYTIAAASGRPFWHLGRCFVSDDGLNQQQDVKDSPVGSGCSSKDEEDKMSSVESKTVADRGQPVKPLRERKFVKPAGDLRPPSEVPDQDTSVVDESVNTRVSPADQAGG